MSEITTPRQQALVRSVFEAMDDRDYQALGAMLDEDVVLVFGNGEAIHGRDAMVRTARDFRDTIADLRHDIAAIWSAADDEDLVTTVTTVHYERLDGQRLALPCANVFRIRHGRVTDYRIYMDVNPVFASA